MATKVDEQLTLSSEERKIVVLALTTLGSSVKRSITTERNELVVDLRNKEYSAITALIGRFS